MGLFDRLFGRLRSAAAVTEGRSLLLPFLDEVREYDCADDPRFVAIMETSPAVRAEVAAELAKIFLPESARFRRDRNYVFRPAVVTLWNALCASELELDDAQLCVLVDGLARGHVADAVGVVVVAAVDRALEQGGVSKPLRASLQALATARPNAVTRELRRTMAALGIDVPAADGPVPLSPPPKRKKRENPIEAWVARLPVRDDTTAAWTALLEHAATAANKSRPSQRYLREGQTRREAIGPPWSDILAGWLQTIPLGEKGIPEDQRDVLKGLLWLVDAASPRLLVVAVSEFAERCYKKIPDVGPTSAKLGNAAVLALGRAGEHGAAALSGLAFRVKYASARQQITRTLDAAAERAGVSRDDLEEKSVPGLGFDDRGVRAEEIGNYTAEIALEAGGATLRWRNRHGKRLKNVPAPIKKEHGDRLAALRREVKSIGSLAGGQQRRLEGMWLARRAVTAATLREHYIDHPLVGHYARRLVWSIELDGGRQPVLARGDHWEALGEVIEVAGDRVARLWHPIELEEVDEIAVWRDWLTELGIVQPFSQLYRDIYRAQGAGPDERFAGHVLLQRALREQCRRYGWSYQLQGYWDSANAPTLELDDGLFASFDADPIEHRGDDVSFEYLVSGAVRFARTDHVVTPADEVTPEELDPLLFSEVMRQVGAMVAASTVTVDPGFASTGPGASYSEYWQRGAWGALAPAAAARAQVVADVLPRTTLRDVAALEERWLVVRGPDEVHRIHVGSGLVRRESDRALVEVRVTPTARRRVGEIFLPFEGDAMLVNVLARAFLLAGRRSAHHANTDQ